MRPFDMDKGFAGIPDCEMLKTCFRQAGNGINGIELHPEISQALVCREQNMNLRRSDEKYAEAL